MICFSRRPLTIFQFLREVIMYQTSQYKNTHIILNIRILKKKMQHENAFDFLDLCYKL